MTAHDLDEMTLIRELVEDYRTFKDTADELQQTMLNIKDKLEPLLEKHGKYEDEAGYAMIVERGPSVSYKGADVDKLVQAWLKSEDPVLNGAGLMLEPHRKEKEGYSYVRVA
jgi:hypothetical protein